MQLELPHPKLSCLNNIFASIFNLVCLLYFSESLREAKASSMRAEGGVTLDYYLDDKLHLMASTLGTTTLEEDLETVLLLVPY